MIVTGAGKTSPQQFKGGSIWSVMVNINGAVRYVPEAKKYMRNKEKDS